MFSKIKRYFQGVGEQARMVRWPKRNDLFKAVSVVLIVMVISGAALTLSDFVIGKLLQALESQTGKTSSTTESVRILVDSLKIFF